MKYLTRAALYLDMARRLEAEGNDSVFMRGLVRELIMIHEYEIQIEEEKARGNHIKAAALSANMLELVTKLRSVA